MTKKVQLLYAFSYCCLVFGVFYLIKTILNVPAPFDWLAGVAISWIFLIPYYRFLYFPKKGYDLQLGFQALRIHEQIAAFTQMLAVPVLAIFFTFISSPGIRMGLFAAAVALLAITILIGEEKNVKSQYTNVNEKSSPIIMLYYSRTKAWIMLLLLIFCLIAPMSILSVMAIVTSGFHLSVLLLAGFSAYFLYLSLRYVRQLRHRKPLLTLNPLYISYDAPRRPPQVIDWHTIAQSGWFVDNSNKQLLFTLRNRNEIKWDVRGLGLEPAALHELIGRYCADYVNQKY